MRVSLPWQNYRYHNLWLSSQENLKGKKTTDSDFALEEGSILDSDDLGENNELSESIEAIICESCGYKNNKGDKFCRKCGKKLI